MKEYVGIYIKTKKAQEQDGFGSKIKYHFHIATLHNYIWLYRVKAKRKDAIFMYCCYVEMVFNVEVVFNFVAKSILFLCFFGFDIYPYILFHF